MESMTYLYLCTKAAFQRLLESAIAVGYVFQFSGRSRDELEDHAELVVSKNTSELKICVPRRFG